MAKCLSYHFCAEPPIYNGRMQWEIRRRLDLYPLYSLWDYTRNREEEITQGNWQTRGNKNNRETRGGKWKNQGTVGKRERQNTPGGKWKEPGNRGEKRNNREPGGKGSFIWVSSSTGCFCMGNNERLGNMNYHLELYCGNSVYIVVVDCSQQRFPNYTVVGTHYWWTVLSNGSQIIQLWELTIGGLFSAKVPKLYNCGNSV